MVGALVSDSRRMQLLHIPDLTDPSGQWLGGPGSGDGQFNVPAGLAGIGNGRCLVADSSNHRIVAFDADDLGNWHALGSQGSGDLQFERPWGVALDSSDRIHVADTGNGRIVRFDDIDGTGWTTYGSPGVPTAVDPHAVGHFRAPVAIAFDDHGRVWIADQDFSRVVRVDGLNGAGWLATWSGCPRRLPPGRLRRDCWWLSFPAGRSRLRDDDTVAVLAPTARPERWAGPRRLPVERRVVVLDAVSARWSLLDGQLGSAGMPLSPS